MRSARWYWKRLRVMRPAELGWRVLEALRLQRLRAQFAIGSLACKYAALDHRGLEFCTSAESQLPELPMAFSPAEGEVADWLSGRWNALGFTWCFTDDPLVWHRAPDTGEHHWPPQFFGTIAYREDNPYGDARVVWEPGRLQQLVTLALVAHGDSDARGRAIDLIARQLESWVDGNPVGRGIHYVSAMECALRLIAVAFAVDLVRDDMLIRAAAFRCSAQLIASHADLIAQRLSLHSSAGNHTIAEGAGLVFAGLLLPELPAASGWVAGGLKVLQAEAARQVLPDGGGIERATWYHLFVVDLLGLVELVLAFKGRDVPTEIGEAVVRGRAFLGAIAAGPETLPVFGDADGGYALSPWLRLSFPSTQSKGGLRQVASFPDAGLTRVRIERNRGVDLVLDHGVLGMPPSYGHGHADALSLILAVGGEEILADCGTYTYTGDREWRDFFRGTRGHNTVMIDGLDQARAETAFMWSRPYAAKLHTLEEGPGDQVWLLARHSGYQSLGAEHWRGVVLAGGFLIVWDGLLGEGEHRLELNWHLCVDLMPEDQDELVLDSRGGPITLTLQGGVVALLRGSLNPIAGWRSPRYGSKVPITTVRVSYEGKLPHEFVTIFSFTPGLGIAESLVSDAVDTFRRKAGWV